MIKNDRNSFDNRFFIVLSIIIMYGNTVQTETGLPDPAGGNCLPYNRTIQKFLKRLELFIGPEHFGKPRNGMRAHLFYRHDNT